MMLARAHYEASTVNLYLPGVKRSYFLVSMENWLHRRSRGKNTQNLQSVINVPDLYSDLDQHSYTFPVRVRERSVRYVVVTD